MFDLWAPSTRNKNIKAHKIEQRKPSENGIKMKGGNRGSRFAPLSEEDDDAMDMSELFLGQEEF